MPADYPQTYTYDPNLEPDDNPQMYPCEVSILPANYPQTYTYDPNLEPDNHPQTYPCEANILPADYPQIYPYDLNLVPDDHPQIFPYELDDILAVAQHPYTTPPETSQSSCFPWSLSVSSVKRLYPEPRVEVI
ncbi:hypothetical protein BJX65DRAFT_290351 [Aspergillus insuetus]